jgi:hypothetical protein
MSSLEEKGKIPRPNKHENGKFKFVTDNPNSVECSNYVENLPPT